MTRRPQPGAEPGTRLARGALAAGLLGVLLAVDPAADAAFDAPKRLVMVLAVGTAAAALTLSSGGRWGAWRWRDRGPAARVAAVLLGVATAWAVLSATLSPRPARAFEGAWQLALGVLLLALGASRALDDGGASRLLRVFVAGATASAVLALLQAAGAWQPLAVERVTGRTDAFALVGNEGLLALVLALALVGAAAGVLGLAGRRPRAWAAAAAVVLAGGLAVCGSLTGLLATAAGSAVLGLAAAGRRAVAALLVAVLGLGATALLPPVRARLEKLGGDLRAGRWDAVVSGRTAPWAAALEMVRERPLVGFGPGTFVAEYVPHRVAAEQRLGRRLLHPKLTAHHDHAHNELLHAAATVGLPGALAALASALALALAGVRALRAGRTAPEVRAEVVVALALLAAGAAAAALWFPLARPVTAMPLLLIAGRLWRLCGEPS